MLRLRPSFPNAFKSKFYRETEHWDADLKVDYDADRNPIRVQHLRRCAHRMALVGVAVVAAVVYRTRKGWHLRAWTETRLAPYRALRFQTLLGDDPFRQRFNARRVRHHEAGWNVLWNEKWRNGRLIMKEVLDKDWTQKAERIFACNRRNPPLPNPNPPKRKPRKRSSTS